MVFSLSLSSSTSPTSLHVWLVLAGMMLMGELGNEAVVFSCQPSHHPVLPFKLQLLLSAGGGEWMNGPKSSISEAMSTCSPPSLWHLARPPTVSTLAMSSLLPATFSRSMLVQRIAPCVAFPVLDAKHAAPVGSGGLVWL